MGLITSESNQMRKSHRIDLPLTVQIGDVSYKTKDWSMTGVSLIGFGDEELEHDQIVASQCVFPMIDSAIALNIKLKFKRHFADFSGFEFTGLSPQVRRVLRQYIELAVEGKLDCLEDVVGVLTTPALDTPLEDALTLSDLEQDAMTKHFKSGSKIAISVGILFLLILLSTLFYNTSYRVDGVALVGSTLQRVRAPAAGIVSELTAEQDAFVKKGTSLFSIASNAQQDKIASLQLTIEQLARQRDSEQTAKPPKGPLTEELAAAVRIRQAEYKDAKILYAQQIISVKDFHHVANQLQIARIAYAKHAQTEQVRLGNSEGQRMSRIIELNHKIADANEQLKQLMQNPAGFKALTDGRIFHIEALEGTYVNAGDVVLVVEADVTPYIVFSLKNYEAVKVHVGMPATIEIPYNGKKLESKISAIGYNAVYGQSTPTQEASLNETLIKLELLDRSIRLPANTRINVWIKTFSWPTWF